MSLVSSWSVSPGRGVQLYREAAKLFHACNARREEAHFPGQELTLRLWTETGILTKSIQELGSHRRNIWTIEAFGMETGLCQMCLSD